MKKIALILIYVWFSILLTILIYKYEIRISILPKCAWIWFYSYYDSKENKCKCYNWYELKNRFCQKKENF